MKRYGNLFDEIYSFANLLNAAQKAQRGKRFKYSTAVFNLQLEKELLCLRQELKDQIYLPGGYKSFFIYDPKKRLISAAPYRDRVVQHALCNVIEPILEKTFIYDSYACRKNKGTHKAVDRFTRFGYSNEYVLKCDIKTYFASIDHDLLYALLERKIKDVKVLRLLKLIIDSTPSPGIPIGNLTSQLFANFYLDGLDHYMKEQVNCKYYIRYMDDIAVFAGTKKYLNSVKEAIRGYLQRLKLCLHEHKSQIYQMKKGVVFLGYKVYVKHRLITKQNLQRFKKRFKKYYRLLYAGKIPIQKIFSSVWSWLGYAIHADTYCLRAKILSEIKLQGISL